jgi:hypothetical protein
MNPPKKPSAVFKVISPIALLLGLLVGLTVLSWEGRRVVTFDWHDNFTRFHPMISPEALYEPSVGEMCAIVRARCKPNKVLVIVGGNSVLLGVGQPADKMWTSALQAELGDGYAVVNLAFRGASPNDAGAIVAETLRSEFPKQVYIANEIPLQSSGPIGIETYRFALLDAYYKGYLLPWKPRDETLSYYLKTIDYRNYHQMDLEMGAKLDSLLYFHNFWNWYSFTQHFTFGTPLMPHDPQAHWPRNRFEDQENDFNTIPFETRFTPQVVAADLNIARRYTAAFYHENAEGSWVLNDGALYLFLRSSRTQFPDLLKPRTLFLIGRNNPYYTKQLDAHIQARDEQAIGDTIGGLESLGYEAMSYGSDFTVDDFGDRTHLTTSGGAKLAAAVGPKVKAMAEKLKYVQP